MWELRGKGRSGVIFWEGLGVEDPREEGEEGGVDVGERERSSSESALSFPRERERFTYERVVLDGERVYVCERERE